MSGFSVEAERTAAGPRLRPVQPEARPAEGDGVHQPVGVVLDFADSQQLPAVLAAPDPGMAASDGSSLQRMQEDRIAGEFISAVTASADQDGGVASRTPVPAAASDARWDAAARQADEEFRALVGQDVYQRKALEAALLGRQAEVSR